MRFWNTSVENTSQKQILLCGDVAENQNFDVKKIKYNMSDKNKNPWWKRILAVLGMFLKDIFFLCNTEK